MEALFRLLLTFNATSLLVVVYEVKSPADESLFEAWIPSTVSGGWWRALTGLILLAIPVALTRVSIRLSQKLSSNDFSAGSIASLELANNAFLPSYLGYFFVALSVPDVQTLTFVYGVLFVFTYLSQALYFNPLFLLYGYVFYSATTTAGTAIFMITRKEFREPRYAELMGARQINNFTYMGD